MIVEALLTNAVILLALVLMLWAVAIELNDVSFIDSFWGFGMALLAFTSWYQQVETGPLAHLLLAMTVIWGVRLGVHLFRRWRRTGEDKRYAALLMKDREAGNFAFAALTKVFITQGILLFLVSSPAQYGILEASWHQPISGMALCGVALWLIGIAFEWIGDWQLARFRADPANAGQVMDRGLWKYTRHPNYFGDAMVWWGIWLAASSAGWWIAAFTVAGPLFLTFTLRKWSGVSLLEKGLLKTRPGYAEYQARTSPFLPWPPRRTRQSNT